MYCYDHITYLRHPNKHKEGPKEVVTDEISACSSCLREGFRPAGAHRGPLKGSEKPNAELWAFPGIMMKAAAIVERREPNVRCCVEDQYPDGASATAKLKEECICT